MRLSWLVGVAAIVAVLLIVWFAFPRANHVTVLTPGPGALALCSSTRQLVRRPHWYVVGDDFMSGNSFTAQLEALTASLVDNKPISVTNLASTIPVFSDQLEFLATQVNPKRLVDGVLIFVCYGTGALESQIKADYLRGDASLYVLVDALAPLQNFTQVGAAVVLVLRPDPLCGGLRVPPTMVQCDMTYINYPTLRSYELHMAVRRAVTTAYSLVQGGLVVNTDALLCNKSLARAPTTADSLFQDCSRYSTFGETEFAKAVWLCVK
jgi:hypothetical protein